MSAQAKSPVTLRVGQVMTGFGAGCGVGLGVGYPIALGSIPVLGDVISATSSAGARAFGGVGHKVFDMLRTLGIKNLKAGVGCGVGFGHGFGVGIALKPGVSKELLHSLQGRLSAVGSQLQRYLPAAEGDSQVDAEKLQPGSLQNSGAVEQLSPGSKLEEKVPGKAMGYVQNDTSPVMTTEPVTSTSSGSNGEVQDLRQENEILRMLIRHQELIEDLKSQNASILQVLSEQLDVQIGGPEEEPHREVKALSSSTVRGKDDMFHSIHSHSHNSNQTCFNCRIAARRRR